MNSQLTNARFFFFPFLKSFFLFYPVIKLFFQLFFCLSSTYLPPFGIAHKETASHLIDAVSTTKLCAADSEDTECKVFEWISLKAGSIKSHNQ